MGRGVQSEGGGSLNYRTDAFVAHLELDEYVKKRGEEGWTIHTILPVKHSETTDSVTIIWAAPPARSTRVAPQGVGAQESGGRAKCAGEHTFVVSGSDGKSRCEVCGITIEEFVNEAAESNDTIEAPPSGERSVVEEERQILEG